ncbi:unnamed protein product, partial [Candidula unifasciata]
MYRRKTVKKYKGETVKKYSWKTVKMYRRKRSTSTEGRRSRCAGGNCVEGDIDAMLEYNLTPTVATLHFIEKWTDRLTRSCKAKSANVIYFVKHSSHNNLFLYLQPQITIEVDTGMSRNGCQSHELPHLMKVGYISSYGISVHSIMTHFSQPWDDPTFTQQQLDRFLEATKLYRSQGIKVHVASSSAIIRGYGTDLDFVRPGSLIYGLLPDYKPQVLSIVQALGTTPALSWLARPCLVKTLEAGRKVGYNQKFKLKKREIIATFSFGYGDGYSTQLSGHGVLTDVN